MMSVIMKGISDTVNLKIAPNQHMKYNYAKTNTNSKKSTHRSCYIG